MSYAIAFKNEQTGEVRYYTGRAGGNWISPNRNDALFAYNIDGVSRLGTRMLNSPALHGRYDVLAVEKLDDEPVCESEGGLID